MTIKQNLEQLALEKNSPCVTISLNTHRTHPDNTQDEIVLKNLIHEAEERVIQEYGKRDVASLLENFQRSTLMSTTIWIACIYIFPTTPVK